MAIIKAKKIPAPKPEEALDTVARFCYHFQQYTFQEARKVPYNTVIRLLKAVEIDHSKKMIDMVHVSSVSDKKGADKVIQYFKGKIEDIKNGWSNWWFNCMELRCW